MRWACYVSIHLTNLHNMKNVILLISFLVTSSVVSAKDIAFNRLNKLYHKDSKQCLVVAKRYMKYLPENASAYYFATLIYRDKVDNARNAKGKYFSMTKSLSYAKKFTARDHENILNEIDWNQTVFSLEEKASSVIAELSQSEFTDLAIRLQRKVDRYEFMNTLYLADVETTERETQPLKLNSDDKESTLTPTEFNASPEIVKISGQFYGLPEGNEVIASHSKPNEQELLRLINQERKNKGIVELVWEEDLAKACRYHACDLGTQDYFDHNSHDRINGELVQVGGTFERIKKFYTDGFVNSENIAAGNETPKATYKQWYDSPGHYANMFNKSSRKAGIGVYKVPGTLFEYYWVFCTALD